MQQTLQGKQVAVVGLGMTGQSCVSFLLSQQAEVIAMDSRSELQHQLDIPVYLGEFDSARLSSVDMILLSPGISLETPAIQQAMTAGVEVIGDIELFARINRTPVIAITGSNGKSTVTMLTAQMCQAAGMRVEVGGNIGQPVLALLDKELDVIVLELSSFQLQTQHSLQPLVACVLNVTDDHLDRHHTFAAYRDAKHSLYTHARYRVASREDSNTLPQQGADNLFGLDSSASDWGWNDQQQLIVFQGEAVLSMADCKLSGLHNVLNIQAAAAMARLAGCSWQGITAGAKDFVGLPHRCELISEYNGIQWINDSKATNVGATVAAIEGLPAKNGGKLILIAGGDGKGADFNPLKTVFEQQVDVLLTIGRDGAQLGCLKPGSQHFGTLQQAVQTAAAQASKGDIVMLSPACASMDMFRNYQQRGESFAAAIKELIA